ncbi:MAG: hypothetical protein GC185_02410 [Alphaproteobacteria bacterium]|nr:hypothetical protein [Alphaproteobacteria bacterium]
MNEEAQMIPTREQKFVNDFKALFNIVRERDDAPVSSVFGRNMQWDGIVATECRNDIQLLEADGISALFDARAGRLQFTEGTPNELKAVLTRQSRKPAPAMQGK